MKKNFFEKLKEKEFKRTVVNKRELIWICRSKVHLFYSYYMEDVLGNIITENNIMYYCEFFYEYIKEEL